MNKDKLLQVRVSDKDKKKIEVYAKKFNRNISEFIRDIPTILEFMMIDITFLINFITYRNDIGYHKDVDTIKNIYDDIYKIKYPRK